MGTAGGGSLLCPGSEGGGGCEFSDQASRVLAAGFRKNKVVREVTLSRVPEKLVESVKRTLRA